MYIWCSYLSNIWYRSGKVATPAVLAVFSLWKWLLLTAGAWWHIGCHISSEESRKMTDEESGKRNVEKATLGSDRRPDTKRSNSGITGTEFRYICSTMHVSAEVEECRKRQLQRQSGTMHIQDAGSKTWNLAGVLDDWQTWLDAPVERLQICAGLTCTKTLFSSVLHLLTRGTTYQLYNKWKSMMCTKLAVQTWLAICASCTTHATKIKGRNM